MRQGICSHSIVTITLNNPVTPTKPTRNRPQTDKSHQVWGEIGLQSVLIRFCQFGVGLCSGRQICWGGIFQTCLKDLSPTNCRLCVGYISVWCRFCRGAFGDVSVLIRPLIPQSHRRNRHETDKTRKICIESASCRPPTMLLKTP